MFQSIISDPFMQWAATGFALLAIVIVTFIISAAIRFKSN